MKFPSLKPKLGGKYHHEEFCVFDIESNNWKDFVCGGVFDGKAYQDTDSMETLFKILLSKGKATIYSHFGGIFDHLFIIDYAASINIFPENIIMRGSSVFMFELGHLSFVDSSGILPFSLERAAKSFGVKTQKLKIDHSVKKVFDQKNREYLKHDCIALYQVIEKFRESEILKGISHRPSLSGLAVEKLQHYLTTEIPSLSDTADRIAREAYAGGRVEVFRPYYYNTRKKIHYYDFNSMYPAVMKHLNVAGSFTGIEKKRKELSLIECEVVVKKDTYLPILWKKQKGKMFFPVGKFSGIFTEAELKAAEENNQLENLKIKRIFGFQNLGTLFTDFVTDLYYAKEHALDDVQRIIAKLLLNSAYGKISIKRDRETLTLDDGQDGIKPIDVKLNGVRLARVSNLYRGFSNARIGAEVTAQGRLLLWGNMNKVRDTLYYCDTDSIITPSEFNASKELGKLKLEDSQHKAVFLGPKNYIFGDQVKMKGFPKEFQKSLNFDNFKDALQGDLSAFKARMPEKLKRLKSARNSDTILTLSKASDRQLKSRYDKRILFKTNNRINSRPVEFNL